MRNWNHSCLHQFHSRQLGLYRSLQLFFSTGHSWLNSPLKGGLCHLWGAISYTRDRSPYPLCLRNLQSTNNFCSHQDTTFLVKLQMTTYGSLWIQPWLPPWRSFYEQPNNDMSFSLCKTIIYKKLHFRSTMCSWKFIIITTTVCKH